MKTEPFVSRHTRSVSTRFVFAWGAALLSLSLAGTAVAEVRVDEPWARATVPGQQASGAFMTLTSSRNAKLVEVQSPAAGIAEIHEMALENNVMRMRSIDGLELPAGQPVVLRPGGFHLMLLELKAPLQAGTHVDLRLTLENADGTREHVDVKAPVRPLAGGGGSHHGNRHGH